MARLKRFKCHQMRQTNPSVKWHTGWLVDCLWMWHTQWWSSILTMLLIFGGRIKLTDPNRKPHTRNAKYHLMHLPAQNSSSDSESETLLESWGQLDRHRVWLWFWTWITVYAVVMCNVIVHYKKYVHTILLWDNTENLDSLWCPTNISNGQSNLALIGHFVQSKFFSLKLFTAPNYVHAFLYSPDTRLSIWDEIECFAQFTACTIFVFLGENTNPWIMQNFSSVSLMQFLQRVHHAIRKSTIDLQQPASCRKSSGEKNNTYWDSWDKRCWRCWRCWWAGTVSVDRSR